MKYKLTQKRTKGKKYKINTEKQKIAENTANMTAFAKIMIDNIIKSKSL